MTLMSKTKPTFLAQRTMQSGSHAVARTRALKLYRSWQREAPEIVSLYQLDLPLSVVRSKIRAEFEKHRFVQDLPVIDMLLFKGHSEYQETANFWKQKTHVMRYFMEEESPARRLPDTFLGRFLEGKN
ncbi:NADH dehydrogenase, alpha subcomplex, subunit 6 [Saitoella complicata NRRL Y-17804]|uniref:Complex 1 LYR protein domain-containing protein n=1 Tax=Saitoella complicata (strain BCRC 22490 / CBS 7301 / JCM 7358 / NBRC 10748 / NRRL Y-17804) TaxID=698492 RepID=A0A0E9N7K2_SAICN|nr:NADH dehydrogenase, alpha subcomplex, subunit 6 [Saitoella complicata NRRL Y-17804]ODQ54424.1 NADH dehydrogenase, alpha subcomplex, subunit 6 [Saitoella complicata NRRL Y-17804]GAO45882.1 hypothetical protein G7K_0128-t1 [Saitoella complicata NRRL Y-17804]